VPSQQRTLMLFGGIGVLLLALVIAAAVFMKPLADETDDSSEPSQPQQSQPAPPARKPPLD